MKNVSKWVNGLPDLPHVSLRGPWDCGVRKSRPGMNGSPSPFWDWFPKGPWFVEGSLGEWFFSENFLSSHSCDFQSCWGYLMCLIEWPKFSKPWLMSHQKAGFYRLVAATDWFVISGLLGGSMALHKLRLCQTAWISGSVSGQSSCTCHFLPDQWANCQVPPTAVATGESHEDRSGPGDVRSDDADKAMDPCWWKVGIVNVDRNYYQPTNIKCLGIHWVLWRGRDRCSFTRCSPARADINAVNDIPICSRLHLVKPCVRSPVQYLLVQSTIFGC